jgi:pantothenate synthetase
MNDKTKTAAKSAPVAKSALSPAEKKLQNGMKKTERFHKLAVKRMTKTLKAIDNVAALGNRRSYTYTDAEAQKIIAALQARVEHVVKAFSGAAPVETGFTL